MVVPLRRGHHLRRRRGGSSGVGVDRANEVIHNNATLVKFLQLRLCVRQWFSEGLVVSRHNRTKVLGVPILLQPFQMRYTHSSFVGLGLAHKGGGVRERTQPPAETGGSGAAFWGLRNMLKMEPVKLAGGGNPRGARLWTAGEPSPIPQVKRRLRLCDFARRCHSEARDVDRVESPRLLPSAPRRTSRTEQVVAGPTNNRWVAARKLGLLRGGVLESWSTPHPWISLKVLIPNSGRLSAIATGRF